MNLIAKIAIGVAVGFGGGFAAGYFTHKKMNDVQFEEISEEEMNKIEQRVEEAKKRAEETAVSKEKDIPENLPEDPDKLKLTLQGKKPYSEADREQKAAYEKMWQATKDYSTTENANDIPIPDENETSDETDVDPDEAENYKEETWVEPPHPIDLSDYYNDRPDYDKITIHWYEPDNTWLDENEKVIPDIKSYIGDIEVKSLFTPNSEEEDDVRFVRNDKYGSDYEIIRHHRTLREALGGVE